MSYSLSPHTLISSWATSWWRLGTSTSASREPGSSLLKRLNFLHINNNMQCSYTCGARHKHGRLDNKQITARHLKIVEEASLSWTPTRTCNAARLLELHKRGGLGTHRLQHSISSLLKRQTFFQTSNKNTQCTYTCGDISTVDFRTRNSQYRTQACWKG